MEAFTKGDTVICVDATAHSWQGFRLVKGTSYSVSAANGSEIRLEGCPLWLRAARFKLTKGAENMNITKNANPFKKGDTVCYTGGASAFLFKGREYTVKGTSGVDILLQGFGSCFHHINFVLVKSVVATSFTKDQLKPGMRVVLRDSTVLVACVSNLQETGGSCVAALCYYHDNGIRKNSSTKHCDIMEVWSGPELAIDFFDMSKMGALLFKRVEKTEEELKKEAQLKDIAELETRLADLKSKINS